MRSKRGDRAARKRAEERTESEAPGESGEKRRRAVCRARGRVFSSPRRCSAPLSFFRRPVAFVVRCLSSNAIHCSSARVHFLCRVVFFLLLYCFLFFFVTFLPPLSPFFASVAAQVALISLPSLPPRYAPAADSGAQLTLAREAHELGLLLEVRRGADPHAVRAAWSLLRPLYSDARAACASAIGSDASSPFPLEPKLTALYVLHLAVDGVSPATLPCLLETLPASVLASDPVARAVALEAALTEGAYSRALAAGKKAAEADPDEAVLLARLADAALVEMALCAAAAYGRLSLADAAEILDLPSEDAVLKLAESKRWQVDAERKTVLFQPRGEDDEDGARGADAGAAPTNDDAVLPAETLISNCLMYAGAIERIV